MAYTARGVTAATAPWPLVIGKRTYWARPLSAAFVLRVVPMMARRETAPTAVAAALRAAFPRGRWWRRDPLRDVLRLTPDVQAKIVAQLFAIPGAVTEAEMDPLEALMAAHRKMARPESATSGPSLALASLTCQVRLGAAWWHNPALWPTVDGFAPHAAVWTTYYGLVALDAQERLAMAQAVSLGQASGPKVQAEWDRIQKAAYPADPTMRGMR